MPAPCERRQPTPSPRGCCSHRPRGLYVPVPPQYRSWRVVPADQFIDVMMSHLGCDYYVGFLSAAAHWGAAHQAVQEYQVVVNRHVLNRDIKRVRLRFHQTRHLHERDTA